MAGHGFAPPITTFPSVRVAYSSPFRGEALHGYYCNPSDAGTMVTDAPYCIGTSRGVIPPCSPGFAHPT